MIDTAKKPSRRSLFVVATLLTASACTSSTQAPGSDPSGSPNVLVIVTDDQRAEGTLGVMPNTKRRFVDEGVVFTRAFATTPACCPSRASIFSGRYAHNHGVQTNADADRLDERRTLQRALGDAGYLTAIVGKYLNRIGSYRDRDNVSISPGHFDRWDTFLGGYEDPLVNSDGSLEDVDEYSTSFVARRTIELLQEFEKEEDDRPWFLYVAPFAPHAPFTAEDRYSQAAVPRVDPPGSFMEEDVTDKPRFVQELQVSAGEARRVRAAQLRTLLSVDDLVSELFDALDRLDEDRATLAIFLSDHGYLWGEHGVAEKRLPYTESIAIPLMLRWPDRLPEGTTDDRLAATIDLAPTILDAVNASDPVLDGMDGTSLLGDRIRVRLLLEQRRDTSGRSRSVPTWASIRNASRQYIEYYGPDGRVRFRELYDLENDPEQLENLLSDSDPGNDPSPQSLRRLSERLARDRQCRWTSGPNRCP